MLPMLHPTEVSTAKKTTQDNEAYPDPFDLASLRVEEPKTSRFRHYPAAFISLIRSLYARSNVLRE